MESKEEIGEDQVWAALPYLNQHKTTERFSTKDFARIFRLKSKSGGFSEASVSIEEFLQYLVDFVPNLKDLEIEDARPHLNRELSKPILLQPLAIDLLLKIENLTEVSINGVDIKFTEFVRVCRESRNLKFILADNILVDMEPTNSMKNILETLASNFAYQKYEWEFPRKFGMTLKKTDDVTPHREAQVTLSKDFLELIPSGLMKLEIQARQTIDIQSERNCLLRNLSRVGGTLKALIIEDLKAELNITFKHIFEHCIELESLTLTGSYVADGGPITSFGRLKSFTWINKFCFGAEWSGTVGLGRFLSAPLLEDIAICLPTEIDLGDKELLLYQIRNRMILTKLTKMEIRYYVNFIRRYHNEEGFHELARALRSLGCESYIIRTY